MELNEIISHLKKGREIIFNLGEEGVVGFKISNKKIYVLIETEDGRELESYEIKGANNITALYNLLKKSVKTIQVFRSEIGGEIKCVQIKTNDRRNKKG